MMKSTQNTVIVVNDADNVGIVAVPGGLQEGTLVMKGIRTADHVPMGHKLALQPIVRGEAIIRFGEAIGHALVNIGAGKRIEESMISLPDPPDLRSIPLPRKRDFRPEPPGEFTFMGYRNSDGSVGTRNLLGISTSVQCVAGFTRYVENKIREELLPDYPNVDGVVSINHTYGCGVAIDAPAAIIPIRTLRNIISNPNFGEEVLLVGLGCEKLQPERLVSGIRHEADDLFYLQHDSFHGFGEMVDGIMKLARLRLERLNGRRRVECPASDLVVGMQCGGSDAFSGITSNPAAGFAADLIVRAGGSVMFSEVTEVRDAIHLLVPRAIDEKVGKALLEQMEWYDEYLQRGRADRSANPSPGNKRGGLSNVVEKALGSIAKSGTSPIVDVIGPGEKIRRNGLTFAATPANDFICGTLQLAAGMNMHVFMTGMGSPYGLSMVPVIKVSSNSGLSKMWPDLIDLDAGVIAGGNKTIEETGWELFRLILDVASGKKQVATDKIGLYNDLAIFNPGPVT
jgi:galactarate dehydratase